MTMCRVLHNIVPAVVLDVPVVTYLNQLETRHIHFPILSMVMLVA